MSSTWPDHRIIDLLGVEVPVILAPMAGAALSELAVAVAEAGGLGSLPCAMLNASQFRSELSDFRKRTVRPANLNFFCHHPPAVDAERETAWRERLSGYYVELGLDPKAPNTGSARMPFDAAMCDLIVELKPEVVSFHFGFPERQLLARVRDAGAKILASATTVDEARWLEREGCDAVIAQGYEAGGHRGMFLTNDISTQIGTIALVPQVVDAVKVPVIAAGGIGDARGIVAALALGASAVQLGTAWLILPGSHHWTRTQAGSEKRRESRNCCYECVLRPPGTWDCQSGRARGGPPCRTLRPSSHLPQLPLRRSGRSRKRQGPKTSPKCGRASPLRWAGNCQPENLLKRLAAETLAILDTRLMSKPVR